MSYTVSQEDIEAYRRDGAVPLQKVIDEAARARLEAAIEDDIREPGPFFMATNRKTGAFP